MPPDPRPHSDPAVSSVDCVDVGSTLTKTVRVELPSGRMLGASSHRTTVETDVMAGVDACLGALAGDGPSTAAARACSSAGGGLRIAVVGNEQLITAEAGRSVALSSGGHVVAVLAGELDDPALRGLEAAEPDVVLLVGGTDGGNPTPLLRGARALARLGGGRPVVVAGNADATPDAVAALSSSGLVALAAGNVLPRVGELDPGPARAVLRQVFLSHVIGGKHLSVDPRFTRLVRAATPDAVLAGVELLAAGPRPGQGVGDLVLVDVGGATTDVHSVVHSPDTQAPVPTRTVEGDLGVRWSAPGTVAAAIEAGWVADPGPALAAAERLRDDPGRLPTTREELAFDQQLARWAIAVALRRHAGRARPRYVATGASTGRWVERAGNDLREVGLVVGSGGVLRHAVRRGADPAELLGRLDPAGGWQLPRAPEVRVDADHVVAAAGLLAADHPAAAWELLAPMRVPGPRRTGQPGHRAHLR